MHGTFQSNIKKKDRFPLAGINNLNFASGDNEVKGRSKDFQERNVSWMSRFLSVGDEG